MLHTACQNGCLRSVKLLLAHKDIRVNQATHDDATSSTGGPFQRVTPLRIAAQQGHLGVVRVLVKHKGIDLDKPGKTSDARGFESPLQVARRRGHHEIVRVLLAAGAKDADEEASEEERKMAIVMGLAMRNDE